jgi:hypothetical protein
MELKKKRMKKVKTGIPEIIAGIPIDNLDKFQQIEDTLKANTEPSIELWAQYLIVRRYCDWNLQRLSTFNGNI